MSSRSLAQNARSSAYADLVREPETDEAAEISWIPLDDAAAMISDGRIAGAATVIGVQYALMLRAGFAEENLF